MMIVNSQTVFLLQYENSPVRFKFINALYELNSVNQLSSKANENYTERTLTALKPSRVSLKFNIDGFFLRSLTMSFD